MSENEKLIEKFAELYLPGRPDKLGRESLAHAVHGLLGDLHDAKKDKNDEDFRNHYIGLIIGIYLQMVANDTESSDEEVGSLHRNQEDCLIALGYMCNHMYRDAVVGKKDQFDLLTQRFYATLIRNFKLMTGSDLEEYLEYLVN